MLLILHSSLGSPPLEPGKVGDLFVGDRKEYIPLMAKEDGKIDEEFTYSRCYPPLHGVCVSPPRRKYGETHPSGRKLDLSKYAFYYTYTHHWRPLDTCAVDGKLVMGK